MLDCCLSDPSIYRRVAWLVSLTLATHLLADARTTMLVLTVSSLPAFTRCLPAPTPYLLYIYKPNGVCGPAPLFTYNQGPACGTAPLFTHSQGPALVPPAVPLHYLHTVKVPPAVPLHYLHTIKVPPAVSLHYLHIRRPLQGSPGVGYGSLVFLYFPC